MRIFVYGKLKTNEAKSWMLPESMFLTRPYVLTGYKMYTVKKNKVAGLVKGSADDKVFGEIKESREWVPPFILRLILFILDINEGTPTVYKREEIPLPGALLAWVYLYAGDITESSLRIYEWSKDAVRLKI